MAEVLLISRTDLVKHTALNGNIDTDKFIQFIASAQNIHIQQYLGTNLLEKLKSDYANNTLTTNYANLIANYVKPMLVHFAMVEYLPFVAYSISNKGIYKHSSENSETVEKNEVDFLVEKERQIAQNYAQRFVDYMCFNQNLFPEYNTNTNGNVFPENGTNLTSWYL